VTIIARAVGAVTRRLKLAQGGIPYRSSENHVRDPRSGYVLIRTGVNCFFAEAMKQHSPKGLCSCLFCFIRSLQIEGAFWWSAGVVSHQKVGRGEALSLVFMFDLKCSF